MKIQGFALALTLSALPAHRADIDGLRAMAILGVLAFHAFPSAVPGGFAGVDVFFVISGYVVSLSLLARASAHSGQNIAAFYARRIRRLFPALLCMLPAVALVAFWLLPTQQLALLGKHILSSAGFAQNLVLWQEAGYFDAASHEKWLLHLWSLGIEEQFYVLLPLLFLLKGKGTGSRKITLLLALLAAGSVVLSFWQSRQAPSAGFYWPLGRFWEFLMGVGLAGWHSSAARAPRHLASLPGAAHRTEQPIAAIALASLILAFLLMSERPWEGWHFPGPQALWPTLATFALLCTSRSAINRRVLSHPAMRYLGLISFPLYLWHWPVMAYLNALDPHHALPWTRVLGLLLALALAALTFHFVEQPARRLGTRRPKMLTSGLSVAMASVALMGWMLWAHTPQSWPDRQAHATAQLKLWDETTLYRDSTCLANAHVNPWIRNDFFCRGDPDTARWALLGDSHANALAAGLMKAMPGQWVNLGGGGCVPFDGVDSGSDAMGLQCPHEIPESFLRHIINSSHIQGVMIDVRGAFYVDGTDVGGAASSTRRWLREVPGLTDASRSNAANNAAIFQAGVRRTLHTLGAAGKRVVWVLNTPELGADPPACLRPLPGQNWIGTLSKCAITSAEHETRNTLYSEIVLSEIRHWNAQRPAQMPAVRVLDPAEVLCTRGHCPLVREGVPLYRDGDHLSIQGSDLVARWLIPQLPALP